MLRIRISFNLSPKSGYLPLRNAHPEKATLKNSAERRNLPKNRRIISREKISTLFSLDIIYRNSNIQVAGCFKKLEHSWEERLRPKAESKY